MLCLPALTVRVQIAVINVLLFAYVNAACVCLPNQLFAWCGDLMCVSVCSVLIWFDEHAMRMILNSHQTKCYSHARGSGVNVNALALG